jgi:hypothetical protein
MIKSKGAPSGAHHRLPECHTVSTGPIPAVSTYLAILTGLDFIPESNPGGMWFRRGNVRVVVEDDSATVYALDGGGSARWDVRLTGAPADMIVAVVGHALNTCHS